jgi:hypothetical protein
MALDKPGRGTDDGTPVAEDGDLTLWEETRRGQVVVDPSAQLLAAAADPGPSQSQATAADRDAGGEDLPASAATSSS